MKFKFLIMLNIFIIIIFVTMGSHVPKVEAKKLFISPNALNESEMTLDRIVLETDGKTAISISLAEYNAAYLDSIISETSFNSYLNNYIVRYLVTNQNNIFTLTDYNNYYLDIYLEDEVPKPIAIFTKLKEDNKNLEIKEGFAKGYFGENGLISNTDEDNFEVVDIN